MNINGPIAGNDLSSSTVPQTKTFAILFGSSEDFGPLKSPFYGKLLEYAESLIHSPYHKIKYYVNVPDLEPNGNNNPEHMEFMEDLAGGKIDGVLVANIRYVEQLSLLYHQKVPTVVFIEHMPDKFATVTIDWDDLIHQGVHGLTTLGCRRLGLIIPAYHSDLDNSKSTERMLSFRSAVKKHQLNFHLEWFWDRNVSLCHNMDLSFEERGYWLMKKIYEPALIHTHAPASRERILSFLPDGLVFIDDMMARGALVAAEQMGLDITREVRIATHANSLTHSLGRYWNHLTLMEIDVQEVVRSLFRLLELQTQNPAGPKLFHAIKPHLMMPLPSRSLASSSATA